MLYRLSIFDLSRFMFCLSQTSNSYISKQFLKHHAFRFLVYCRRMCNGAKMIKVGLQGYHWLIWNTIPTLLCYSLLYRNVKSGNLPPSSFSYILSVEAIVQNWGDVKERQCYYAAVSKSMGFRRQWIETSICGLQTCS